jgi:hypothetical protein
VLEKNRPILPKTIAYSLPKGNNTGLCDNMAGTVIAYAILEGKILEKRSLGKPRRWGKNFKSTMAAFCSVDW